MVRLKILIGLVNYTVQKLKLLAVCIVHQVKAITLKPSF